jgi:O-antigen ligase
MNPLTGGGWFSLRFWNDRELGRANVNLSHNIILQGLSDGGFPLGIALAIIVIGSAVLMIRYWRSIPTEWKVAATVLLVCGLWDMPQLRAFGSLVGGIALGLVSRRHFAGSESARSESAGPEKADATA